VTAEVEVEVEAYDDATTFLGVATGFLESRPVEHNLILSLLHFGAGTGAPARYWLARDDGGPLGVAMQSPLDEPALVTPMPVPAVRAIVDRMAAAGVAVPGVAGEAGTAAAFAGYWSEAFRGGARPGLGMRLSLLGTLVRPAGIPGGLRPATRADLSLVVEWGHAFADEVGEHRAPEAMIARRVDAGHLWLWEVDGAPVCLIGRTDPVAGVVRVGPVYTPAERRGCGYAAVGVGEVSATVVAAGGRCILYTDLDNPTSNGVYRRLGYAAVSEVLRYDLAPGRSVGPAPIAPGPNP
jgi:hypothetical protein